MPSKCPNCHENAVDGESGEQLVCHNCGVVVDSRVFNFESGGNGSTWMSANGTAKFDGRFELPNTMKSRLPTDNTSIAERQHLQCLKSLVRQLNLSHKIHDKARELLFGKVIPMRNAKQLKGTLYRPRSLLAGACLLIVCRQSNIQLTYRRMAQFAECNMFVLGRCVKIVSKSLGIDLDPVNVESLIIRNLSELSVSDSSCQKLSLDLCRLLERSSFTGARHVAARAITVVLLVLEFKRMLPDKERIAEILGTNSVTKQALSNIKNILKENLLQLAKEVPWIPDSVKKRDITKHIGAIVDFHDTTSELDTTVIKSPWMKKKEIADKNCKAKIQKAKSLILSRELGEAISSCQDCRGLRKDLGSCHGNGQGDDDTAAPQSSASQEVDEGGTLSSKDGGSTVMACGKCAKHCTEVANDGKLKTCDCHTVVLIEELLQSGYSEEELMDGYFESRISDLRSPLHPDPEGEREDLDEKDIADQEMHHYLLSVAEVERIKNIKEENMQD